MQPLFQGPNSLREPSERLAFWLTALFALPAALLIGYVLHESIGASQVALFIVIAMVYVTLARGRLLGSSVRVHETQYPRVFSIVKRTCAALEIPMPMVFVREDNYVPVVALGFGEPYALVCSSHWIEVFRDDELAFMIGCELGHIAAGHTRFLSLLSVNGNENPLISLIFGAWLRRCSTACDKIGLLCCGSLDAAIRAICVAAFHEFGRKVDYQAFAEQQTEIQADTIFRWGAWLGSEPYATTRIASLRRFMTSQAYIAAEEWFLRERDETPPEIAAPGTATVTNSDCAGWWRRFAAFSIDAIVVTAIITSFGGNVKPQLTGNQASTASSQAPTTVNLGNGAVKISASSVDLGNDTVVYPAPEKSQAPHARRWLYVWKQMQVGPFVFSDAGIQLKVGDNEVPLADALFAPLGKLGFFFWFPIYLALLVMIAGQTFGMMISGLRTVTTDFRRPGIFRTIARYAIVMCLWWLIMPLSFVWRRVLLHDRWTKTRVVKVERVVAHAVVIS